MKRYGYLFGRFGHNTVDDGNFRALIRSYTGFDFSIQSAFETAAEMNDIIAEFLINAIIRMTETDVNTTADADGCATGGVCCFTAHAHLHATYTGLYVNARISRGCR